MQTSSFSLPRLTALLVALSVCSLRAQSIDLYQAYEGARLNDPTFRMAVAARDAGAEEVNIARAGLLPSITATYTNDRRRSSSRSSEWGLGTGGSTSASSTFTQSDSTEIGRQKGSSTLDGTPVRTLTQEEEALASSGKFDTFSEGLSDYNRRINGSSASLQLRQPLIDFEGMATYRQGRALTWSSDAYFQDRQQALMLRVAVAYAEVLFARENVVLSRLQLETLEEQLKANERMFQAGTGTVTDTLETSAKREIARAQLIESEDIQAVALNRLKSITGLKFDDVHPLEKDMAFRWQPSEPLDVWLQRAVDGSALLQSLRHRVQSARYMLDRTSAAHLPRLDLVLSLSNSRSYTGSNGLVNSQNASTRQTSQSGETQTTENISSRGIAQPEIVTSTLGSADTRSASSVAESRSERERSRQRSVDGRIGIELTIPLFAGGGISARERQAVAQVAEAEAEFDQQLEEVSLEINKQLRLMQSHSQRATALAQAVEASKVAVEATRRGMVAGIRSNLDVINAQERLTVSQRDLANAQYSFLLSYLQIRYFSGVLSENDLKVVSGEVAGR